MKPLSTKTLACLTRPLTQLVVASGMDNASKLGRRRNTINNGIGDELQTFAIMAALGFFAGVCLLPVLLSIFGPPSMHLPKVYLFFRGFEMKHVMKMIQGIPKIIQII